MGSGAEDEDKGTEDAARGKATPPDCGLRGKAPIVAGEEERDVKSLRSEALTLHFRVSSLCNRVINPSKSLGNSWVTISCFSSSLTPFNRAER